MPIYAYKCSACGHEKDVLQKMSDAPLSICPACGAEQFAKQLTAAGFQLKGSGWYATDFKGDSAPAKPAEASPSPSSSASTSATSSAAPSPACGTGACPACN